ncbi:hypothetical protein DYBT9275_01313 [Dyadobacter sp. CECT 9275]|uniref:FAD-dependent oxidoreductase n=1 Tax=Dyadobacter helix TaxID=2822344 RepID=A0A916JDE0_9BACT|nr:FAD-dependent oxidoreductase [Dyadobacter sp. CECT 9275]CAG4994087.1 hypothetical protein DYBT9275_01313 [Dyadobacter sp. CECT 9275]
MSNDIGKTVLIMGGGVAGLSAAHELLKRGFRVTIVENRREILGGKARSVKHTFPGLSNSLPAEHGFRFFPGFYGNITRTLKEIKLANGKSVFDNLVRVRYYTFLFTDGREPINIPLNIVFDIIRGKSEEVIGELKSLKKAFDEKILDISDSGRDNFIEKLVQLYTSCESRYLTEYERVPWEEFIEAKRPSYGRDYRLLLAEGVTKNLVACRADRSSTRTGGKILSHMIWQIVNPFGGRADRILNAPTRMAWLDPWRNFLESSYPSTLTIIPHRFVDRLIIKKEEDKEYWGAPDSIEKIEVKDFKGNVQTLDADYFISALPVERLDILLDKSTPILDKDPTLRFIKPLCKEIDWMTGIMFYLKIDLKINDGHITITNSPFAITIISQVQYWEEYIKTNPLPSYKGQPVKSILSVIVSNWDEHGVFVNKPLKRLTETEVKTEIWHQIKQCVIIDDTGQKIQLNDSDFFRDLTFLDDSIGPDPQNPDILANKEPLLINTVVSHSLRPDAHTRISNFFLAADFVKTNSDLADMDTANEAARRAVNNILQLEKKPKRQFCKTASYALPSPFGLFSIPRIMDERNFRNGLPWQKPMMFYWFCKTVLMIGFKAIKLPKIILYPLVPLAVVIAFIAVIINYLVVIVWKFINSLYFVR